jgi:phosphatidate phosphatase APP1
LRVQAGSRLVDLTRSGDGGFVAGRIVLPDAEATRIASGLPPRWLQIRAVLRQADRRAFVGAVQLIEPSGLSVISDIDDTIKETNVLDRREMARNTFARPFRAVAEMADLYASWMREAAGGIAFHYVSAGPWQLFEPLEQFRQAGGFPPGSFHLREFSVKRSSAFASPDASRAHKLATIERLMKSYPQRRFILVGDSGEQDPEVYGEIARRFPRQIERVLIRDVTGKPTDAARFQRALAGVPAAKQAVFRDARDLMPR